MTPPLCDYCLTRFGDHSWHGKPICRECHAVATSFRDVKQVLRGSLPPTHPDEPQEGQEYECPKCETGTLRLHIARGKTPETSMNIFSCNSCKSVLMGNWALQLKTYKQEPDTYKAELTFPISPKAQIDALRQLWRLQ